jgi:hypothetical protein
LVRAVADDDSKSGPTVVGLLSFAAALAACGYVAASIRLGAARLLAFLVFATTCAMLAISTPASLWYEGSLLVLGPVATIGRRGSVRAATSCPPLAELLRCPA